MAGRRTQEEVRALAEEVQRLTAEGHGPSAITRLTGIPTHQVYFYRSYDFNRNGRQAQPPAWNDHPDKGCDESPRCTECPLPACKFDRPERPARQRVPLETLTAPRRGNDMAELNTVYRPGTMDGVRAGGMTPAPTDWTDAARAELTKLIAEVEAINTKREKATRIHAALTTFGLTDLPALPWQRSTPAQPGMRQTDIGQHERARYRTPECQVCGHVFTGPANEFVITRQGSMCRSIRRCDEYKAAGNQTDSDKQGGAA